MHILNTTFCKNPRTLSFTFHDYSRKVAILISTLNKILLENCQNLCFISLLMYNSCFCCFCCCLLSFHCFVFSTNLLKLFIFMKSMFINFRKTFKSSACLAKFVIIEGEVWVFAIKLSRFGKMI